MYHAIPFWLREFLLRIQLIAWWEFWQMSFIPCCFVFIPCCSVFNFCQFDHSVSWSLCVLVCSSSGLSYLGLCASWTWLTLSFPMLGKLKSLSHVQLLVTPLTVAHQAPPSMGFSRQEYWTGLPFPSPGDLPDPGIKPRSPTLQTDALPSEPPGEHWAQPGCPTC